MTTEELARAHRALAEEFRAKADYHDQVADELEGPRVGMVIGKRAGKPKAKAKAKATTHEGKKGPRPTSRRTSRISPSGRYKDAETKAAALKLLAEGKSVPEVAKQFKVTAQSVRNWRKAAKAA